MHHPKLERSFQGNHRGAELRRGRRGIGLEDIAVSGATAPQGDDPIDALLSDLSGLCASAVALEFLPTPNLGLHPRAAEYAGADADHATKCSAEVSGVTETTAYADVSDAEIGLAQQSGSGVGAHISEVG